MSEVYEKLMKCYKKCPGENGFRPGGGTYFRFRW